VGHFRPSRGAAEDVRFTFITGRTCAWLHEPNLGPKAVDAIFYVFDHVARPDAVGWIGA
jgi:hypothetical protein